MTDQASTFVVNFAGRDIVFRHPIPGQLIILRRRMLRLQQEANQTSDEHKQLELGNRLIVDILDVVESLILDPEDAAFLEAAMLAGKVGHEEVISVIGIKEEQPKPNRTAKRAAKSAARTQTAKTLVNKVTANNARTKR